MQRDVAIDLPGGPVRGRRRRRRASVDPRLVELELAAQAEHGHGRRLPRRRDARRGRGRSRPSISCCSATPRRSPTRCETPARSSSASSSPVAAGDYATGGNHVLPTGGWARSVGGLGIETFLKPITMQRLHARGARAAAPDRRGARRGRGHARARGGGAAMRALAPEFKAYSWAPPTDEVARARRDRPVAGRPLRPEHPAAAAAARRGPARSPARSRAINGYPAGGYPELRRAIADYDGVEPGQRRARRRRRRPDPALRALLRRPRATRSRSRRRRPTRSTALAAQLAGRARSGDDEPGADVHLPAEQPRPARCAPLPDARPLVVDEAYYEYCGETASCRSSTTA